MRPKHFLLWKCEQTLSLKEMRPNIFSKGIATKNICNSKLDILEIKKSMYISLILIFTINPSLFSLICLKKTENIFYEAVFPFRFFFFANKKSELLDIKSWQKFLKKKIIIIIIIIIKINIYFPVLQKWDI